MTGCHICRIPFDLDHICDLSEESLSIMSKEATRCILEGCYRNCGNHDDLAISAIRMSDKAIVHKFWSEVFKKCSKIMSKHQGLKSALKEIEDDN